MAQRIDGQNIPLHIKAEICDYVSQGETSEEQSERRDAMARKYRSISRETISAMTAHIKFRMSDTKKAVFSHMAQERAVVAGAQEGLAFAETQEGDSTSLEKIVLKAERSLHRSEEAWETLRAGKLREAIEMFGKAGDVDALLKIASVYENERPDIAAEALIAAKQPLKVLALVAGLSKSNRQTAKNILTMLSNAQ